MRATRKQIALAWILFAVVFAALLITATFTDLQVSQILTKGTLPDGSYLAKGIFGVTLECLGCTAPYLMGGIALELFFIYILRFAKSKGVKIILGIVLQIADFATWYAVALDTLNYNVRHYGLEGGKPMFMKAELIFVAALLVFLSALAANSFSDESIKRVPNLCYATALAIALSSIAVTLLKEPFGRPRFRAMNYAGDFSYYSRWYVINHQPDKEWMKEFFSSTDACKSFPSGHTQSAAMIFCIVMLKDMFAWTSKKKNALLWIVSIVWTGAVALSRIMVGAHFFSDVLVGGTIGFLSVMLAREILVYKGYNCKTLFKS